ncbi:MAG: alkaline phosphatase family protein [Solirubrobacterales bacterium]|nr:alkaline phosphatase family protein [Solirubrobacterales bacterium]
MAQLVLGPLLRYVGETEAVVWVETDEACEVEVLGRVEPTFQVAGHHYALLALDGLEPGETYEYGVALDGAPRWPEPGSRFPASTIRTLGAGGPLRICFGSCRVSLPDHAPYTLPKDDHPDGREFDALHTLTSEMLRDDPGRWPRALVLLGDQVYADEVSPETLAFIRKRRDVRRPPGEEVADFEEYVRLYRESWSDPAIRWLLSTVSVSMVVDDHDINDDWNISAAWVAEMREQEWWAERECAGIAAYWLYQFIGNLSPELLRDSELLAEVRAADDGWDVLRGFAANDRGIRDGARWSYCRDLDGVRLIVVDSRCGRVLEEGRRSMLDEREWGWLERHLEGDFDHLLIGTSDPLLLAPGLHQVERWGEAVCAGAWGARAARSGERLRRALDLDHWAAFGESFERLSGLLEAAGAGRYGAAPASITVLSGDVHHAYLAEVAFRREAGVSSSVWQAVCSPFRNALSGRERMTIELGNSGAGARIGRALARSAGVPADPIRWRLAEGPFYDNQVATLELDGRAAKLKLERTRGDPETDDRELQTSFERSLV